MGELKESFLEAEMALADARRKLRQAEINALKKAREGMEEELAKSRLNLAATEHLLSNYQREAVQFDTAMQGMEEQIDSDEAPLGSSPCLAGAYALPPKRLVVCHIGPRP